MLMPPLAAAEMRFEPKGTRSMANRGQRIFKPEFKFGLGGVQLGNEFNKHTDKEAEAALEAAWEAGVRYYGVLVRLWFVGKAFWTFPARQEQGYFSHPRSQSFLKPQRPTSACRGLSDIGFAQRPRYRFQRRWRPAVH